MRRRIVGISVGFFALIAASSSQAAIFSFEGNFASDDDIQLFNFVVGATSQVTLRTFSYAGGTNGEGELVQGGGFDPILALFDSSGELIDRNDDDNTGSVPTDAATGRQFDTLFSASLAAGTYTVAVTQFDNEAIGPLLSSGFSQSGAGNFTASFGCSQRFFCDVTGSNRNSSWAFDIAGVETASLPGTTPPPPTPTEVPVPAGFVLLGSAIAGLVAVSRRRRKF
jgi:hypothetical protein